MASKADKNVGTATAPAQSPAKRTTTRTAAAAKAVAKTSAKPAPKAAVAAKKARGLGRGLDALLGGDIPALAAITESAAQTSTPGASPSVLALDQLVPGKYQPRTRMDEGALNELAASIREQGIMQPVLVRPLTGPDAGKYEIIAGERRFRAAGIAGLKEVPVLVREVPDEHAAIMALVENIQREDLNPLEEAHGVRRLLDEFGLTHELAAQAIGRSRSATSNLLRLLNLAGPVQTMLLAGDIDMGHARALLSLDAARQIQLANFIVAKALTVREAEKLVARALQEDAGTLTESTRTRKAPSRDVLRLEEALSDQLGTKVTLKIGARERGKIVIDFHGWEHLSALLEKQGLGSVLDA
ncbi:ParB/RepB/Spo0J family partition protein [Kerstersia similis]|uniref:ParB/RepB/Spo0J family partition protein n=1 Tax=Kerstersia similis TaxID=206505 RepID=UPI0039EFCCA9